VIDRRLDQMRTEGVKFRAAVFVGVRPPAQGIGSDARESISPDSIENGLRRDRACSRRRAAARPADSRTCARWRPLRDGLPAAAEQARRRRCRRARALGDRQARRDHRRRRHRLGLRRHVQPPRRQSIAQFEVLPMPPDVENNPVWPYWPVRLRTSSSHEEGVSRDWSVASKEFVGENGKLKRLRAARLEWKDGKPQEVPGSQFEMPTERGALRPSRIARRRGDWPRRTSPLRTLSAPTSRGARSVRVGPGIAPGVLLHAELIEHRAAARDESPSPAAPGRPASRIATPALPAACRPSIPAARPAASELSVLAHEFLAGHGPVALTPSSCDEEVRSRTANYGHTGLFSTSAAWAEPRTARSTWRRGGGRADAVRAGCRRRDDHDLLVRSPRARARRHRRRRACSAAAGSPSRNGRHRAHVRESAGSRGCSAPLQARSRRSPFSIDLEKMFRARRCDALGGREYADENGARNHSSVRIWSRRRSITPFSSLEVGNAVTQHRRRGRSSPTRSRRGRRAPAAVRRQARPGRSRTIATFFPVLLRRRLRTYQPSSQARSTIACSIDLMLTGPR